MSRALSFGLLCLGLAGCINGDVHLYEFVLDGQVSVPDGAPSVGAVHLEFHVAESQGVGDLAHPLGLFDERTLGAIGPLRQELLYPKEMGRGLVVYGFLDLNGDGLLCAPGQPEEPAGLVEVAAFPAHQVSMSLVLDKPCVGPESLYP